jgi:hypothetical protein
LWRTNCTSPLRSVSGIYLHDLLNKRSVIKCFTIYPSSMLYSRKYRHVPLNITHTQHFKDRN